MAVLGLCSITRGLGGENLPWRSVAMPCFVEVPGASLTHHRRWLVYIKTAPPTEDGSMAAKGLYYTDPRGGAG